MTFNDVFKSSFLDSFSSFSLLDTALCLGAAFVIGLFIFYVYQKTYSGVLYSRSFNVSLVAILMEPHWSSVVSQAMWYCLWVWLARCLSCVSVLR